MPERLEQLARVEWLASVPNNARAILADALTAATYEPGEALIRQGAAARTFALITEGRAHVVRSDEHGDDVVATLGPGSLVGELALLSHRPRTASVVEPTEPTTALHGTAEAFALLVHLEGVHDYLAELVAGRLVENAAPITLDLRDGTPVAVRCLLPRDRAGLVAGIRRLSQDSLHKRFFSGGQPTDQVIDFLMAVNHLDHFAWVMVHPHDPGDERGIAVARFIRVPDEPDHAEVAFAVADEYHGRGIATVLFGALAAAAPHAGITTFAAEVLAENTAMRAVFGKAGAHFHHSEPGVVATEISVGAAAGLIDPQLVTRFEHAAAAIASAYGLAP